MSLQVGYIQGKKCPAQDKLLSVQTKILHHPLPRGASQSKTYQTDSLGFYSSGMAASLHSRSVTFPAVKGRAKEGETKKISCLKSTTCATMVSWRPQVSWAVAGSPLLPNALQRRNKSPNQPWCWEKTFRSCFLSGDSVYYYISHGPYPWREVELTFSFTWGSVLLWGSAQGLVSDRVITTNPKLLFLLLKKYFLLFCCKRVCFLSFSLPAFVTDSNNQMLED